MRSWWHITPGHTMALPAYLARAWRRAGRPVICGTPSEAAEAMARLSEPAPAPAMPVPPVVPTAAAPFVESLFATEAA